MTEPLDPKSLFFKTPEKQEGPILFTDVIARWFGEWVERGQETEYSDEANWIEAELRNAYAQGAASRDAEVEALKAEVARFSRDANYWKWCNGCGSAKEDCEKWKDAGKVACCPECHHWPWNR